MKVGDLVEVVDYRRGAKLEKKKAYITKVSPCSDPWAQKHGVKYLITVEFLEGGRSLTVDDDDVRKVIQ